MMLRFATRGSKLALWQTRTVMAAVRDEALDLELCEVIVKTLGDRVVDQPLFRVGGQGLFIKELEEALRDGRADLAVHSLKDVPHQLAEGLTLVAISAREDPREALVSRSGARLAELPAGAVIGTSSLRRRAQLRRQRPDLRFADLRGNLDTRLRKLDEGQVDAIVLAAAGLRRLGLAARITELFDVETLIPAAGQGFLGVEARAADLDWLWPLMRGVEDPGARRAATAERAFLSRLQGGCQVPLAVHAVESEGRLRVIGFVSDPTGERALTARREGPAATPEAAEALGAAVAADLLAAGAADLLTANRADLATGARSPAPLAVPPAARAGSGVAGSSGGAGSPGRSSVPAGSAERSQRSAPDADSRPALDAPAPSEEARPRPPATGGRVFLVGAGPGDPGLITVRGLALVRTADVIVHDALGATSFLAEARPDAVLINAGKRAGAHTLTQDEINATLVREARAGRTVVRLKGGDPMVFGRGGEELEALAAAGVPFEVVPGVTSAIAGPAAAGIPVTHRDFTSELAIVTGHDAEPGTATPRDAVPWASLAGLRTIVFLMGVRQLPHIVRQLIEAGKDPATPVALIEQATSPRQRCVTGTLATIVERAQAAAIQPPSIIVVGRVVELRERLAWLEKRPLFGRTIVVTRSRAQAAAFCQRLEELGATVLPFPTIRIERIDPNPAFAAFLDRLVPRPSPTLAGAAAAPATAAPRWTHLVFTSVNGAETFWDRLLAAGLDARALAGLTIVCIGPVTAEAFRRRGVHPDVVPDTYVAEALLPFFQSEAARKTPATPPAGQPPGRVAILRAETARDVLPDTLRREGWEVEVVVLYRTVAEAAPEPQALAALREGRVDAVTFTSSSTVEHFLRLIDGQGITVSAIPAVSIGPVTTATIQAAGLRLLATASVHTIPGLTDCLVDLFRR